MTEVNFQFVETNGIRTRLAVMGEGPLVIFCHGWPESWYSYRHQLPVVAKAGYKAVAYDVRGYGESDKPHAIDEYTMKKVTADVAGIIEALGYKEAITIGHDWGAPIAMNTAVLYPKLIKATGTMSVPFTGRGPMPALDLWKEIYKDKFFYQLYFQQEGVAEEEFEKDMRKSLFITYTSGDGRGMREGLRRAAEGLNTKKGPDATYFEGMIEFDDFPSWLSEEDLDYYTGQFEQSGMRGPLNRYRAQNIDWHELPQLDTKLTQPAFFITGTLDPVNFFIQGEESLFDRVEKNYENLILSKELEGIGHWTQQEAPKEVNATILEFLDKVSSN